MVNKSGAEPVQNYPGLSYWRDAIFERDRVDRPALVRMLAHPRFAEACALSARNWVDRLEREPIYVRMTKDMSTLTYGYFVMWLDATEGVTITAISEFCRQAGIASPGRATAILLQLRLRGFVRRDHETADRRVRRYVPTEALVRSIRGQIVGNLRALSLIEPEAAIAAERINETPIMNAFIRYSAESIRNVMARGDQMPELRSFFDRSGGTLVLYRMALSGERYPAREPIRMSASGFAKEFGISRTHVRRMLDDAEKKGLIRRNADEQSGVLLEPLREALANFHAVGFMLCATSYLHAVAQVERGLPSGLRPEAVQAQRA